MNNSFDSKIVTILFLLAGSLLDLSAQEDLFKQLIKESIKMDLKNELLKMESAPIDSLSGLVLPQYKDSIRGEEDPEISEYLMKPYTNPKFQPKVSRLYNYENMIPKSTFDDLNNNNLLSVTGLMGTISSLLFNKKKEREKVNFSENDKEALIRKTNDIIREYLLSIKNEGVFTEEENEEKEDGEIE